MSLIIGIVGVIPAVPRFYKVMLDMPEQIADLGADVADAITSTVLTDDSITVADRFEARSAVIKSRETELFT